MAIRNVNKRSINKPDDFNQVIEDICKGRYVLVLGSEVMLDKNQNVEANGDSALFSSRR